MCTDASESGFVGTEIESQKTPVILVHGIGSRDKEINISKHWGRVPAALEKMGHPVFFGNQDAWGTVVSNAVQLAETITSVCTQTQSETVVIVAHSKGGLDSLAAQELPGVSKKIAAIITLSTPHNGMRFCDALLRSRIIIPKIAAPCVNAVARLTGDTYPDSLGALRCLQSKQADQLVSIGEPKGLISVGFSGCRQKGMISRIVSNYDGENDGLVSLDATRAGEWQEVCVSSRGSAFRHDDCTDSRMCNIELTMNGTCYPSIVQVISELVKQSV